MGQGKTNMMRDAFGFSTIFSEVRFKRPNEFESNIKCPFCNFSERDRLLWEDEECFIVFNKYPVTRHSYVLNAKAHTVSHSYFMRLFGRMVNVVLNKVKEDLYPLIFRNHGPLSSASLTHAHGQVIFVNEVFFDPNSVAEMLQGLDEKWKIKENIYAYPFPIRDFQLMYIFDDFYDEKEWEVVGSLVEKVEEAYVRFMFKKLTSHNVVVIYPPQDEFNPFAIILPRPSPIGGIELFTRVSVVSFKPENVSKLMKSIL